MMFASSVGAGTRMAGAFMRNVKAICTSPAAGATNTSSTVTLQGRALDPFKRAITLNFQMDRVAVFSSAELQTSSNVSGLGWGLISWASAAAGNGQYFYRARAASVIIGAGPSIGAGRYSAVVPFVQAGGAGVPRSLYLYENIGINSVVPGVGANARAVYLYVNEAIWPLSVLARALYLYVNEAIAFVFAGKRCLYLYHSAKDGEVFPYLNSISPEEQYVGGQVSLIGDGFGQYLDATQAATISVSSTSGGSVGDNAKDGTTAQWLSTSGGGAWIRFTFGAAKRIVAVVLEGATTDSWGLPRFKFDDASQQDGSPTVPAGQAIYRDAQFPVGALRQVYWLATPKVSTYVEVAIASGGSGTNRGFSEVWVIEETSPAQNAETARAVLNLGLPAEISMGIVSWLNRSPNWWPANGGGVIGPAAVVTVPVGATSGLVKIEETT